MRICWSKAVSFTDTAEGLSECRTQSGITSTVADINAGSVAQDKELVKPVRNSVWEALRTIPSASLSKEQKEQIMSVTGPSSQRRPHRSTNPRP